MQFSGGRESQGKWLLTNLASEGSRVYDCNWGWESLSCQFQMDSVNGRVRDRGCSSLTARLNRENMDFVVRKTRIRNLIPTLPTCVNVSSDLTCWSICFHFCHMWIFMLISEGSALWDNAGLLIPTYTCPHFPLYVTVIWKPFTDHYFSNPALERGWTVDRIKALFAAKMHRHLFSTQNWAWEHRYYTSSAESYFPSPAKIVLVCQMETFLGIKIGSKIQKETKQKLKRKCSQKELKT